MSDALLCDNCGEVLPVNERGDDANGDSAAWLVLKSTYGKFDLCSRSCVVEFCTHNGEFIETYEAGIAAVAAVTRAINGEDD